LMSGDFYVVNKILSKGLHTEGEDAMTYTTNLMDKLERIKQERQDDTIHDEVAAKAYIEKFALDTFERAENQIRANNAKKCVRILCDLAKRG
jgi:vacuolar protein sorting-associated protein VTA1